MGTYEWQLGLFNLPQLYPLNYDSCSKDVAAAGGDGCGAECNWKTEFGYKSLIQVFSETLTMQP